MTPGTDGRLTGDPLLRDQGHRVPDRRWTRLGMRHPRRCPAGPGPRYAWRRPLRPPARRICGVPTWGDGRARVSSLDATESCRDPPDGYGSINAVNLQRDSSLSADSNDACRHRRPSSGGSGRCRAHEQRSWVSPFAFRRPSNRTNGRRRERAGPGSPPSFCPSATRARSGRRQFQVGASTPTGLSPLGFPGGSPRSR